MPLSSLIRRFTSTPDAAAAADDDKATPETLFPVVSKETDGEECLHDCEGCPGYGRAFDKIGIEEEEKLWGGVKKYSTHVIVATGETDWIRDVEEIKGSVMQALAGESDKIENGRLMISASNIPPPHEYFTALDEKKPAPTSVIVLPSFTVVENVTPSASSDFVQRFISAGPTTADPLQPPESEPSTNESEPVPDAQAPEEALEKLTIDDTFKTRPYPHDYLILICSHKRRDARCGISAPILRKEFEKQLRPLGLWRDLTDGREGGCSVVFINHVGGHKFSANVIIYRKTDGQGIWLARVAPKHVEGIVKYTILQGKIVHTDMIKGGFNRKTGATSW
ncbi:hypothetical protein RUND412_003312 [Rhizina undulata]